MNTGCQVILQFKGVTPLHGNIVLYGGEHISRQLLLHSELMTIPIQPQGKLDKWRSVYHPSAPGKVLPLGERDSLFNGSTLYHLVLEYSFDQPEALEILPVWPSLQGELYESDILGRFYMIFDQKKKLIAAGDAWPKKCKVNKGKYTLRLQIRSEKTSVLDKFTNLPLLLLRHLKSSIPLSFRSTKSDAAIGDKDIGTKTLNVGSTMSFCIREPEKDSLPKGLKDGDCLVGSVTYVMKNGKSTFGANDRPEGYPVEYYFSRAPPEEKKNSDGKENTDPPLDKFKKTVHDAKIKHVKSLVNTDHFDEVFDLVAQEYPDDIQLKVIRLNHFRKQLEKTTSSEARNEHFDRWIAACDEIIALIDADEIARKFGVLQPLVDPAVEEKKNALAAAYAAKAKIFLDRIAVTPSSEENLALHDSAMKELKKWADTSKDAYWALDFYHDKALKRSIRLHSFRMSNNVSDGDWLCRRQETCLPALLMGRHLRIPRMTMFFASASTVWKSSAGNIFVETTQTGPRCQLKASTIHSSYL